MRLAAHLIDKFHLSIHLYQPLGDENSRLSVPIPRKLSIVERPPFPVQFPHEGQRQWTSQSSHPR